MNNTTISKWEKCFMAILVIFSIRNWVEIVCEKISPEKRLYYTLGAGIGYVVGSLYILKM